MKRELTSDELEAYDDIAAAIHRLELARKLAEFRLELDQAKLLTNSITRITTNLPCDLLRDLRQRHTLPNFVETGTGGGVTAMMMSPLFERVWTIELCGQASAYASMCLSRFNNVTALQGYSPEFLRVFSRDKPTLFWLDAHWCGGPRLGPECPLLEELDAIGGLDDGSVILIDDARLFVSPPPLPHNPEEWPALADICAKVRWWDVNVQVIGDVILIEKP